MDSLASTVAFLEQEEGWRQPSAFLWRADAADRLDLLLLGVHDAALQGRALDLLDAMDALDREGFAAIRDAIRRGEGRAALEAWLEVGVPTGQHYDMLDHLLAGVLDLREPHVERPAPPPEMVFYQPTPARHIVDGIRRAAIASHDVVLDIGAGLGHVPMLVNVLTGARAMGVEREPAYVASAMDAVRALGLGNVSIVEGDARDADLSTANVFYLFTPFVGTILRDVAAKIEQQARQRPVRIVTLGPCSRTFARMRWLRSDDPVPTAVDRIVVFHAAFGGR
jgi:hypothetical protein